ncbi:hypothetical protein VTK73DRAFT_7292 [Phialemonium thermophilum]|uniref:LysM domain-containing protein n=1 Tax=Phialemonium thermophilum TaxID=223376 RepID=A0ABR3WF59_9PEZI
MARFTSSWTAIWVAVLGATSAAADCSYKWAASPGDTCASMASDWGITTAQFIQYNPSVGPNCENGLSVGQEYCVEWDFNSGPPPPPPASPTTTSKGTTTTAPSHSGAPEPTQPGLISTCTSYYQVASGDTCGAIVSKYGTFSLDEFYKWNPGVGKGELLLAFLPIIFPHLPSMNEKIADIVSRLYQSLAPPTTTQTSPAGNAPSPMQTGIISTCNAFYKVQSGDTCQAIVDEYGTFSLDDFYKWNKGVGDGCTSLWVDYYVCVGVPGTPSKPTATTSAPAGPTPTQPGIIASCNAWYQAKSGDFCQALVDSYKTFTLADFIKWNPAVQSDCSGLWIGYYYCVGVKS